MLSECSTVGPARDMSTREPLHDLIRYRVTVAVAAYRVRPWTAAHATAYRSMKVAVASSLCGTLHDSACTARPTCFAVAELELTKRTGSVSSGGPGHLQIANSPGQLCFNEDLELHS